MEEVKKVGKVTNITDVYSLSEEDGVFFLLKDDNLTGESFDTLDDGIESVLSRISEEERSINEGVELGNLFSVRLGDDGMYYIVIGSQLATTRRFYDQATAVRYIDNKSWNLIGALIHHMMLAREAMRKEVAE